LTNGQANAGYGNRDKDSVLFYPFQMEYPLLNHKKMLYGHTLNIISK